MSLLNPYELMMYMCSEINVGAVLTQRQLNQYPKVVVVVFFLFFQSGFFLK